MLGTARPVFGVTIRLTEERWHHITEEHAEVAGHLHDVLEAIGNPEAVYAGGAGEVLAVRPVAAGKYVVVVYREQDAVDGFVITAFLTRRIRPIEKRIRLWPH